jgi:phosphoribosylaminoimidazolecarboxamide formyltransferase / IMP cyclohydrolase
MNGQRTAVHRAILSVSDTTGLVDLARRLATAEVELIASGGTAAMLAEAGLDVTPVADVTGSPEILSGRVKTLHPAVHGAILADPARPEHLADLEEHGIGLIDLVVVNLYPFAETAARPEADDDEVVEQIDIGGVALIRAAAKNHARVGVVISPDDYDEVASAVEQGGLDDELRRRLATRAFFHTAGYDAAILDWLQGDSAVPETMALALERFAGLRYGENPHQQGAIYRISDAEPWWSRARVLQGKEMSFNNYADSSAAWRLVWAFPDPAAVIVKHTNPCGVAVRSSIDDAYRAAWDCDPLSAFGGVVALNRPLDQATADRMRESFLEVVIAPEVEPAAADRLAERKGLRIVVAPRPDDGGLELRPVEGGFLAQTLDRIDRRGPDWKTVSSRQPTSDEWSDLEFAWTVVARTKSNAIVIAIDGTAVGIGAGDQSRVGAAERAVRRADHRGHGGVAASEALFPFRDGIDTLAAAGVTAVIEPGGSVRDQEVIAAAEEHGMALVFTGRRHFLH